MGLEALSSPVWAIITLVLLILIVLWIMIKVVTKIHGVISKKRMLARWANTPKDVVIVHRFPAGKTCPNPSPFVVKLETYLRMIKVPYEVDEKDFFSETDKCPWVTLNGVHYTDSQLILDFFVKRHGKQLGTYTEEERAVAKMARIMMDEHFYWGLLLWRYVYTKGADCYKFYDAYPRQILTFVLRYVFSGKLEHACWMQGSGRLSKDNAIKLMSDDLRSLSLFLGNKKFLLGDEACEEDCAVFGQLAQTVWCCPDSPYEKLVNEELTNLKDYCFRMKTTFWPDWDDCLSGGKKPKGV